MLLLWQKERQHFALMSELFPVLTPDYLTSVMISNFHSDFSVLTPSNVSLISGTLLHLRLLNLHFTPYASVFLSMRLCVCLSACLPLNLYVTCLFVSMHIYLSLWQSPCQNVCLIVFLVVHQSACTFIVLSHCMSVSLAISQSVYSLVCLCMPLHQSQVSPPPPFRPLTFFFSFHGANPTTNIKKNP